MHKTSLIKAYDILVETLFIQNVQNDETADVQTVKMKGDN